MITLKYWNGLSDFCREAIVRIISNDTDHDPQITRPYHHAFSYNERGLRLQKYLKHVFLTADGKIRVYVELLPTMTAPKKPDDEMSVKPTTGSVGKATLEKAFENKAMTDALSAIFKNVEKVGSEGDGKFHRYFFTVQEEGSYETEVISEDARSAKAATMAVTEKYMGRKVTIDLIKVKDL